MNTEGDKPSHRRLRSRRIRRVETVPTEEDLDERSIHE
jgi:hypothetical protein